MSLLQRPSSSKLLKYISNATRPTLITFHVKHYWTGGGGGGGGEVGLCFEACLANIVVTMAIDSSH